MSVLLGIEATAGLSASVFSDLEFVTIPAGTYEVGAKDQEDNLLRREIIDSFELSTTTLTNRQQDMALEALGDQRTILMFESEGDRRYSVVASGTKKEMENVSLDTLRSVVA